MGDPGVGKTAIAEGLARKIISKDTPEVLSETTIFSLDMGALLPALATGATLKKD